MCPILQFMNIYVKIIKKSERMNDMNFKRTLTAVLTFMMIFTAVASAKTLELTIGSESLYVSDKVVTKGEIDSPAYIENGRTMVPIRVISENFGAEVLWDGETKTVTIKSDDTEIKLTIDNTVAKINGTEHTLDAAPVISESGRTMVPIRFISEALGRKVEYIAPTSQILISDEKAVAEIAGSALTIDDYKFLAMYIPVNTPDFESYIANLNYFAEEVYVWANAAKAAGITPDPEILDILLSDIIPYSEEIYGYALLGNAAKLMYDYALAITYTNSLQPDVDASAIKKIYSENYIRAKHILILTSDEATGEPFDATKKAEARALADDLLRRIKKGADFDTLVANFSQDPGSKSQPDGYVFTKGEMVKPFEDAAFSLKIGEVSSVIETDYGYHIIKKYPLPEISADLTRSISQNLMQGEYTSIFEAEKAATEIKYNKTNKEILELLLQQ